MEAASRDAELRAAHKSWKETAALREARLPRWTLAVALLAQAKGLDGADAEAAQLDAIRAQRLLLASPDPVAPVLESVAQRLRTALLDAQKQYAALHAVGTKALAADPNWQKIQEVDRASILHGQQLAAVPSVKTGDAAEVHRSLSERSLEGWRTTCEALPTRFDAARLAAAKLCEPTVTWVKLPSRTLWSNDDVASWLDETRALLAARVKDGPVMV